jgi:hypothetical protein
MHRLSVYAILLGFILLSSCNSNEIGDIEDVNPDNIYFDYKVWGEDSDPNVTVLLQYRFAGPNGTTLFLRDPAKVSLDGRELPGDSSKMTGAYYELIIPVNQFDGKHVISFTDINGKTYDEEFEFRPISFKPGLNDTISRENTRFEIQGLEEQDYIRLIMTDTSFTSNGISRFDTVHNGVVEINRPELDSLVNGPVHLEIYRESEKEIKNGTAEGGKLLITYAIKKEIFLKN